MNLLPFPLWLKFRSDENANEVVKHRTDLADACSTSPGIGGIAYSHLSSNMGGKDNLTAEWTQSLILLIDHVPVNTNEERKELHERLTRAVRLLKSHDNMYAPSAAEVVLAAGHDLYVPGGQWVQPIISRVLREYTTFEALVQTLDSLRTSVEYAEAYITWLKEGMPWGEPNPRNRLDDGTPTESQTRWHRFVYPKISDDTLAFLNGGKFDKNDFDKVHHLKFEFMQLYYKYAATSVSLLSARQQAMERVLESRRRR